jgi:hypothetical protein
MSYPSKRYTVIGFLLDFEINPDGTPCRSVSFVLDTDDPEEALNAGLSWEAAMEEYRGSDIEYDEVQVLDSQATYSI